MAGRSVWVVDAHALIFQVFHAIPEMTGPRGEPVNALFGFTRDMLYLLEEKRPDYLICAFDAPGPTFRHTLFEAYKADRGEMPDDLRPQIAAIGRVLDALAIYRVQLEGYEADDILATIARQVSGQGGTCYLVTNDKDCRQLIDPHVRLYNVRKDQLLDIEGLAADWGIRPEQVVDFQALVGDPVDGVPGVPLIGPKIARELLTRYGTLDEVLAHAGEISGTKRRENLLAGREQALLSRQLVRLDDQVPVEIDWQAARVGTFDLNRVLDLFREYGFRSLGDRARELVDGDLPLLAASSAARAKPDSTASTAATRADAIATSSPAGQSVALASLPDGSAGATTATAATSVTTVAAVTTTDAESPPVPSTPTTRPLETAEPAARYITVDSPEALAELVARVAHAHAISIDTETTNRAPMFAELVGISLALEPNEAFYLPLRAPEGESVLDASATLEALRPVLEDPQIEKVGQNLKYDQLVLKAAGIHLAGVAFDTMIASYLLDAGERNHSLDELARRYLNHTTTRYTDLVGTGKQQKTIDQVAVAAVTHYAGEDADLPLRLRPLLEERLRAWELEGLFHDLEMPLVGVLADMEYQGVRIDVERLAELSRKYGAELDRIEQEIYALAGHELNIASPKQLQQVLFDELKLPMLKRTKTGPSTDADVLGQLARLHPLPARIVEYRQYAKLKNTYVDSLPALVHPRTGRVHASFNQVVAATGRLSSSDPNLQNIPIRNEAGREIRSAFLPGREGWLLLAADYSQIELRVLAHCSGDATLCAAFEHDEDIHRRVASQVYGVPLDEVTSEMRRSAKAVNFGVIYGQSPFGLANQLGIDAEAAAEFIEAYFAQYAGVEEFLTKILAECRTRGYVKTILGRRRAIRGIRPVIGRQRNLPERTAVNTVIQGSAADLIKLAMVSIHRRLAAERLSAKMVLQIHDELVFELPPEELDHVAPLVTAEMTGVLPLRVPLKVDLKSGRTWADVEAWS